MLRAVIFDVDGTLVDSNEFHIQSWDETFRRYGKHFSHQELHRHIGEGGDQYIPNFLNQREVREFGARLEKERGELYKKKYLSHVRPFAGVRELFKRIGQDGKRIALASSGKAQELDHYRALCHIGDLVDVQTTKDDVLHSKPFPDVFIAALNKLGHCCGAGIPGSRSVATEPDRAASGSACSTPEEQTGPALAPEEAIIVGDTPYDVIAAKRVLLPTIALLCGGFSEDDLRQVGAVAIFRDPADLLANYERSPLAG